MNYLNRHKGKLKARRVLRIWRATALYPEFYTDNSPLAQAMLRTRVLCSGPCCGNPRRHYGERTRQEQLATLRQQEQTAEYWERFIDNPFQCEECGVPLPCGDWCDECLDAQEYEFLIMDFLYELE